MTTSKALNAAGALLLLLSAASEARATGLCSVPESEMANSPKCMRWYFSCKGSVNPQPLPKNSIYASLTLQSRHRIILSLALAMAEMNCEQFSYQEAYAAIQAIMDIYKKDQ